MPKTPSTAADVAAATNVLSSIEHQEAPGHTGQKRELRVSGSQPTSSCVGGRLHDLHDLSGILVVVGVPVVARVMVFHYPHSVLVACWGLEGAVVNAYIFSFSQYIHIHTPFLGSCRRAEREKPREPHR